MYRGWRAENEATCDPSFQLTNKAYVEELECSLKMQFIAGRVHERIDEINHL